MRLDPGQMDAAKALGSLLMLQGRADRASAVLKSAAAMGGATLEVRQLYAEALLRSGKAAEASAAAAELLSQGDGGARAYVLAAEAAREQKQWPSVAEFCERGMRAYPNNDQLEAVYLAMPPQFLAERLTSRIAAVQKAPEVSEMVALGRVLSDGDPMRQTRALEIAQKLLAAAVQIAPRNGSAHYAYARLLDRQESPQAIDQWNAAAALETAPDMAVEIWTRIAIWRDTHGDAPGADEAFRTAVSKNRQFAVKSAATLLEYSRFLDRYGRRNEQGAMIEEALATNPLYAPAHAERARLLAAERRWREAIEEAEWALGHAGDDTGTQRITRVVLVRAYMATGDSEKARAQQAWLAERR